MIFLTADPHLNHDNIRHHCDRPFASLDEMNTALITNWNRKVGPDDETYVVGDLMFKVDEQLIWALNGTIYLVPGNHDGPFLRYLQQHPHMREKVKVTLPIHKLELPHPYHDVVLCHYAMRVWDKSHYNSWHIYGHSHGRLPGVGKSFDIGVDTNNFTPLSIDEIISIMNNLPDNPGLVRRKEKQNGD